MPINNHLQMNVSNFGPITKAEIDLRPLTVFVGPSNTGKSYLAILIYVLHRFFYPSAAGSRLRQLQSLDSIFALQSYSRKRGPNEASDEEIDALTKWAVKLIPSINQEPFVAYVPPDVSNLIRPALNLNDRQRLFQYESSRCFGIENPQRLVRYGSDGEARVSTKRSYANDSRETGSFEYDFVINDKTTKLTSVIPDEIPLQIINEGRGQEDYWSNFVQTLTSFVEASFIQVKYFDDVAFKAANSRHLITTLSDAVGSYVVGPLARPAYYLPADRAGVMHSHQLVLESALSRATQAGLRPEVPLPVFPGGLADFLEQLIHLGDLSDEHNTSNIELADHLEAMILRGTIRSEISQVGAPVFYYQPNGWKEKIPLMNSSSMVSELAPVVLYLRHIVRPGEVLIIEEPESHLHPAMQVEFTRQLAAAVRSGVRVMLTTHSEWVLEELANLVRLSDLPEFQREGVASADIALSPEDVGVWLFRHDEASGGSEVKEIPLDVDSGGFPTEYDDVAMETYNNWAKIGNLIEETHNGS